MLRRILLVGLLATAACDGGGGTDPDPTPNFNGTWTTQSFPGRQGTNFRMALQETGGTVTGTLTYNQCGGASCFDVSDPLSGNATGNTAALTAKPTTGSPYAVTARITSGTQMRVTMGGQMGDFSK
jgi:hypothetical protein